jgi:hypothetical protein
VASGSSHYLNYILLNSWFHSHLPHFHAASLDNRRIGKRLDLHLFEMPRINRPGSFLSRLSYLDTHFDSVGFG